MTISVTLQYNNNVIVRTIEFICRPIKYRIHNIYKTMLVYFMLLANLYC